MFNIVKKEKWHEIIYSMWIEAPAVARAAQPGQFVILIPDEKGERIPLTIADYEREKGWLQVVFQVVGTSTLKLSQLSEGGELFSFVGPLGRPSEIARYGKVIIIGGGTGIACIYPIARALKESGNEVTAIIGARTKDLIIMEKEVKHASTELLITTDDGSYVRRGFVTEVLAEVLEKKKEIKKIWAIGPAVMMKAVCEVTRAEQVETIVSLNAIMVDGTGMCGSCRVSIGEETKFVCVDGPEFDGHSVNWDEFMNRLRRYEAMEKRSLELYKKRNG